MLRKHMIKTHRNTSQKTEPTHFDLYESLEKFNQVYQRQIIGIA